MKWCHIAIILPIKMSFHWIKDQSILLPITRRPQIHISIHPSWHSVAASPQIFDTLIYPSSPSPTIIDARADSVPTGHWGITQTLPWQKHWVARLKLGWQEERELRSHKRQSLSFEITVVRLEEKLSAIGDPRKKKSSVKLREDIKK